MLSSSLRNCCNDVTGARVPSNRITNHLLAQQAQGVENSRTAVPARRSAPPRESRSQLMTTTFRSDWLSESLGGAGVSWAFTGTKPSLGIGRPPRGAPQPGEVGRALNRSTTRLSVAAGNPQRTEGPEGSTSRRGRPSAAGAKTDGNVGRRRPLAGTVRASGPSLCIISLRKARPGTPRQASTLPPSPSFFSRRAALGFRNGK